jgi:hypothetical protein
MLIREIGGANFAMKKPNYRGIEYGTRRESDGSWYWKYYPRKEIGPAKEGKVEGLQDDAISACKAAIDDWLGKSN